MAPQWCCRYRAGIQPMSQSKPAVTECSHTAIRSPSLSFNRLHLRNSWIYMHYSSFTDPRGLGGWIGWPISNSLPTPYLSHLTRTSPVNHRLGTVHEKSCHAETNTLTTKLCPNLNRLGTLIIVSFCCCLPNSSVSALVLHVLDPNFVVLLTRDGLSVLVVLTDHVSISHNIQRRQAPSSWHLNVCHSQYLFCGV